MDKRLEAHLSARWEHRIRDRLHYFLDDLDHNPVIPESEWKIDVEQRVAWVGELAFTLGKTEGIRLLRYCYQCKALAFVDPSRDIIRSWEIWQENPDYKTFVCVSCLDKAA